MKWRRGRCLVSASVLLLLAILALWLRQADLASPPRLLPRCSFHDLTGLHCPGCGNTRAAQALLRGDLAGAARHNVLTVIALPFLLFGAGRVWLGWVSPGSLRPLPWMWKPAHTWAVVSILMSFWILRNLPWPPFAWLAPDPVRVKANPGSAGPATPLRETPPPAGR